MTHELDTDTTPHQRLSALLYDDIDGCGRDDLLAERLVGLGWVRLPDVNELLRRAAVDDGMDIPAGQWPQQYGPFVAKVRRLLVDRAT